MIIEQGDDGSMVRVVSVSVSRAVSLSVSLSVCHSVCLSVFLSIRMPIKYQNYLHSSDIVQPIMSSVIIR